MGTYTLKHTGPEVDRALDDVTVLSETVDELAETVSNLASQAPGSSSGSGAIDCEPGKIFAYAGSGTPQGALLCNGQEVSRTTYWELFDTIGIRYGDGDGSTTFNLPNIASRTIIGESGSYELGTVGGEESHKLTVAEMPSHTHNLTNPAMVWNTNVTNGVKMESTNQRWTATDQLGVAAITNTGGDQSHNNMQPYIVMRYFITTGKGGAVYGINPADYIVEWGETNGWHWEKYASGRAECWGVFYEENNEPYSTWNNMPCRYTSTRTFPIKFIDVPSVSYAGYVGSGFAIDARAVVTENDVCLFFATSASGSEQVEAHIQAKGRWKDSSASSGTAMGHFETVTVDNDLILENKSLKEEINKLKSMVTLNRHYKMNNSISIPWSSGTLCCDMNEDGSVFRLHGNCYRPSASGAWDNTSWIPGTNETWAGYKTFKVKPPANGQPKWIDCAGIYVNTDSMTSGSLNYDHICIGTDGYVYICCLNSRPSSTSPLMIFYSGITCYVDSEAESGNSGYIYGRGD